MVVKGEKNAGLRSGQVHSSPFYTCVREEVRGVLDREVLVRLKIPS